MLPTFFVGLGKDNFYVLEAERGKNVRISLENPSIVTVPLN